MRRETTSTWRLFTRWLIFVGLVGIVASFVIVGITESWESIPAWITFGVSFAVTLLCAVLNMAWLIELLANKRTLFALNVLAMVTLAGCMLAGVNYLAERRLPLSMRRIDITSRGLFGLSSQTENMLTSLDKKIEICALLSNARIAEKLQDFPYVEQVRDLLEEYAAASTNVSVKYVDMMRDPADAWGFLIWSKLPKVLKKHKVDENKFRTALKKAEIITGFNLLRTIDDWDGPKSKIEAMAERKAGHSMEALSLRKQYSPEELANMQKEFGAKVEKEAKKLEKFLAGIKDVMADAKLDEEKQKDFLKAIKDMDVPEPDSNSVIFVCGEKSKHVKPYDMKHTDYGGQQNPNQESEKSFKGEDAFTAAIKEIIDEDQMTVYFIVGHGERSPDKYGQDGYTDVKSALDKSNYKVETLELAKKGEIPEDCDVLVAAAPLLPYNPAELNAIQKFLDDGGALLALFEPLVPNFYRFERKPSPLADLLKKYNIDVRENVPVLDVGHTLTLTRKGLERVAQIQGTVQISKYPDHRIVKDLQGSPSAFRWACYVDSASEAANADFVAARLLEGSKNGWGETDIGALRRQRAQKDKGKDIMAPVPIGAVAESKKKFERTIRKEKKDDDDKEEGDKKKEVKRAAKPTRIVAIGDSDFATNAFAEARGNAALFVNAVSWLAGKESQIGIAPSTGKTPPLAITSAQRKKIFLGSVVGLPVAWVLFGLCMLMVRSLRSVGFTRPTMAKLGIPIGLLLILIGIVVYQAFETWAQIGSVLIAIGIVVSALAVFMGREFVKALMKPRSVAGANTFAMSALGVLIVGMVCFMGVRHYFRFDWTEDDKHALSPVALDVVKSVEKSVNVHALYPAAAATQHPVLELVHDALEEFEYNSRHVHLSHVPQDRDKREAFFQAMKLQPDQSTLVVFQSGDRIRHTKFEDLIVQERMPQQMMMQMRMPQPPPKFRGQEAFANALSSVTADDQTTIYFTTGHKERDISDYKGPGFGELHNVLRRKGMSVKTVNLEEAGEVPDDCDVLIIGAPGVTYTEETLDTLRRYCEMSGSLFVMLEPTLGQLEPSGLSSLLSEYKINVDESVLVVDSGESVRLTQRGFERVKQPRVQVSVTDYGYHSVTEKLKGLPTQFYLACEVGAEESPPDRPQYPGAPPQPQDQSPYNASKLLEAASDGWGDTNVEGGSVSYSDSDDKKGPIPLAACVEPKKKPAAAMPWGPPPDQGMGGQGPRIVCVGDADFASTKLLKAGTNANEDFIMECIRWLTKATGEIEIAAVKIETERMDELKSSQKGWMLAICLGGLPIAWITTGLLVWGFRRRQV